MIVALQETKFERLCMKLDTYLSGTINKQWLSLPSQGSAEGIAIIWDPNSVFVDDYIMGEFYNSVLQVYNFRIHSGLRSNRMFLGRARQSMPNYWGVDPIR